MLRLSVTFVHPETLVGVENRRIFGYYIGENGKKAVLLFVQYLGLLTLLRHLLALGLVSDSETKKIAARLHVDMDADIAIFL